MSIKAKKVAVIGAGISGVSAAAHLLKQGLETVVFERSDIPGGVWHYDERSALESSFPNTRPSVGDYKTRPAVPYSTPPPEYENDKDLEIAHAPPGPSYAGLRNNVSTRLMKTSLQDWPEGTDDYVTQKVLEEYIQAFSNDHGVTAITQYHTRVEEVCKQGDEWVLRTTTLQKSSAGAHLIERRWTFDAVVVASGHYNMPNIPNWPGIAEWKAARPSQVWHSKGYRKPHQFKDKNILIIGASVSANDIAKEAGPYANKIWQSTRNGELDLPAILLPPNATRVAEVKSFDLDTEHVNDSTDPKSPIPGTVTLVDGQKIENLHAVIVATGYITSYPFLSHLHDDDLPASEADDHILVTAKGDMAHNLHKDIFYIPDPTLSFIGAPYHIATFSLFEFQAQAVARVLAGKATLPTEQEMRAEYQEKVARKGLGRDFHSLRGEKQEENYVTDLVSWVNQDAERHGSEDKMVGHTDAWRQAKADQLEQFKWLRSRTAPSNGEPQPESVKKLISVFTDVAAIKLVTETQA